MVAGLGPELAQTPRQQMTATLVLAHQVKRATRKLVLKVRIPGVTEMCGVISRYG